MSAPRPLPRGRLAGSLRIPGSKSLTNRALVAAALAEGESELLNPLDSTDTRALTDALRLLGADIFLEGVMWRVRGPLRPRGDAAPELNVDVGDAGTPARFLAALLAAVPGRYVLDGSVRMRERPMSPLFEAIRGLSGDVKCLAREGFLPAAIRGGSLRGGRVKIRGDVSSQFLSALMLVSPVVPGGIELGVEGPLSSASYLALTRRVLDGFGASPGGGYRPARFRVAGDDSAACFPVAGALVSGGRVTLLGLAREPEQPDATFRAWAAAAGGKLEWERAADGEEALTVTGPNGGARSLLPLDADVDPAPDAALPLAALVAFAAGTSRLSGVARLRDKESDRLAAALDLLRRAGAAAREERDRHGPVLVVDGPTGFPRAAEFKAHGDHRVAMSAAVLALALPAGSTLDDPGVVAKSWPGFWEEWESLLM
ncbi:MAG TPA: 3-phosphoshikimate 1-carboxyvinyltransferase [Thermoanaerobaculia bacterium]|nr:3-phosphoshikimate 1-carboxyvinyltransferase [Thermoanaerobaculia bacterium]